MWDLPRPGLEPVSPALAGRFSTTAPPRKPQQFFLKKAGVAILTSDKVDFRAKNFTRDKEEYYIMIKGSIHQEDITILNMFTPNKTATKYVKQKLYYSKRNRQSTIRVGDFQYSTLSN